MASYSYFTLRYSKSKPFSQPRTIDCLLNEKNRKLIDQTQQVDNYFPTSNQPY